MPDVKEVKLMGRVRVFEGQLYNHDYLWFSSTEISKTSSTLPYLHNYALSYALSQFERSSFIGSAPTYEADLESMPLYTTPASAECAETTLITFNAINEKTLYTKHPNKPESLNTPDYGWRRYLNPVFEKRETQKPDFGYSFYAFVFNGESPRSVFRLGKKGCPIRVRWTEIEWAKAQWSDDMVRPSHPVNPLDVSGKVVRFDPIMLPPHLLLRVADIQGDWFIHRGTQTIHIPKRVARKAGLP